MHLCNLGHCVFIALLMFSSLVKYFVSLEGGITKLKTSYLKNPNATITLKMQIIFLCVDWSRKTLVVSSCYYYCNGILMNLQKHVYLLISCVFKDVV